MVKYKTFSQYYIYNNNSWVAQKKKKPAHHHPVEKIYLVGYISTFENIA